MPFNSFAFAIFLPAVFCLYWLLQRKSLLLQNFLILSASYLFYGWWDWRFLSLIFVSSAVDYIVGIQMFRARAAGGRKALLGLSLAVNLGLLGFFKYYNFFIDSFIELLTSLNIQASPHTLQIILPVGISFYTFQTLSYTIDIYRGKIEPTRNILAFFAFVSFFPQLVAGPIERARRLLPQFLKERQFEMTRARDGLRQILWGLFKKVVIADNLAPYVEKVFSQYETMGTAAIVLGALYFAVQIYCDFSGYSDIAIGTGRLFGFDLMRNFAYPYFSRDVGEFWRRWHISLSTWFRDYVFIPLGGSRVISKSRHMANVMVTFTVSGLWHGASWTFVCWGFLHGLYYLPLVIFDRRSRHDDIVAAGRYVPRLKEAFGIMVTLGLVLLAWIFFRADSVTDAFEIISRLRFVGLFDIADLSGGLPYVIGIFLVEWIQRHKQHPLQIEFMPAALRWAVYYLLIIVIFIEGYTGHAPFIYFQF